MNQVALLPFRESDFSRLIAWVDSPELLLQFAGPIFQYPLDEKQLSKYVNEVDRKAYRVIEAATNHAIGHAELYRTDHQTVKLCRILIGDTSYRGKGLGTAIVLQLLNKAFGEMTAEVAELNVYAWNQGAIRCYKKVGFEVDKTYPHVPSSQYKDTIHMVLRKHMWENNPYL